MSNEGQQDCLEKRKRRIGTQKKKEFTQEHQLFFWLVSALVCLLLPLAPANGTITNVSVQCHNQCLSTMSQHIVFSSNQSVKGLANPLRMVITMWQKSLHWELMWWSSQSDVIQSQHYSANRNWIKDVSENQVSIRNRWYLMSTELKTRKATLRTGVPCMYFSVREGETSQFQIVAFSAHVPTSSATAWRLHTKQPGKTPRDQATVN